MRQFKNWYNNALTKDDGSLMAGDEHYKWRERDVWAKDAWKAALEWIQEMNTSPDARHIRRVIKEELKGGD